MSFSKSDPFPYRTHSMQRFDQPTAVKKIMKYRVELACTAYPLDKMWIDVKLDENQLINVTDEYFGTGAITYSGDARDYAFSLYESSEGVAGIDQKNKGFSAGEIHILNRRVVKGECI